MPEGFADVLMEHGALPRILQVVELRLAQQDFRERYDAPFHRGECFS